MDEFSAVESYPREPSDTRSGEDRRRPTDRRRGNYRLFARPARRDGARTDRRKTQRRGGKYGIGSWLSFLRRWSRN